MINLADYPIEHIGFIVKDLEKTVEHISSIFGIKQFNTYEFSPLKAWSNGKEVVGYKLKIAMSVVEENKVGFEIIQPLCEEGIHKEMLDKGRAGINHIAFKVDDYDYWHEFFKKKGAKLIFESETEDELNGYRRCFYVEDSAEDLVYEIKEKAYFRNK